MKYGHTVKKNGILYPAGAEVPEDIPLKVELTDDVPAGALDTNSDGSANVYDGADNMVDTVDAETVKQAQKEAGAAFAEQEQPKRGRKPKEA